MRAALLSLALLSLAPLAATPAAAADDPPVRESLPTESVVDAWARFGFRLDLAPLYGRLIGLSGAPSAQLIGVRIGIGMRLDSRWSLMGSFQYSVAAAGQIAGVRYSAMIEPTLHLTERLRVAVGLGLAGIIGDVEPELSRGAPFPGAAGTIPSAGLEPTSGYGSETRPLDRGVLSDCIGGGVAGVARAAYLFPIGYLAATGPAVDLAAQWTGCVRERGKDEDTGETLERRQWWPHLVVGFSWAFQWR